MPATQEILQTHISSMKQIFMLAGLFALVCTASCKSEQKESGPESKLLVTTPLKTDTAVVSQYVCQIHSIRHIDLRAQERGYLQKIYVDEGQHVRAGQLLFQIMPKLYEAELNKAGAEVDFADIEYRNTKRLADSNVVAPGELAMARAKLNKAKAELALNKVHYQFTEIRAPFDGIIDKLQVRQGSLVSEGDLLTTLADNSKMWVYFNVPEAEYLDYATKASKSPQEVQLLMANHEVFPQPGVVETIEADFDNETGNIPFRATFQNPQGVLRHGETGNILMNTTLKNALLIPQKATFEVLDKKYVFVVDKESRVKSREIEIAAEMNDLYAVKSGLSEDDKILVEGLRKVKENDKISYDLKDPRLIMSQLRLPAE